MHISLSRPPALCFAFADFLFLPGWLMFAYLASDQIRTGSICATTEEYPASSSRSTVRRRWEKAAGRGTISGLGLAGSETMILISSPMLTSSASIDLP